MHGHILSYPEQQPSTVCVAYFLVLVIMYCSIWIRNTCKHSMGVALWVSPVLTPGVAENANDVGGRGIASVVK